MTKSAKIARVYIRVSTDGQDIERQERIIGEARAAGYYVAATYAEKASGATADRPELRRMIADLQPGDVVIAEKIDRLSRLPLAEAEELVEQIKAKGARLSIPGLVDLSEVAEASDDMARIVLEGMQTMLLRMALHMARDDYETRRRRQAEGIALAKKKNPSKYPGRKPNPARHAAILRLKAQGMGTVEIAEALKCSRSLVKLVVQRDKEEGL